MSEPNSEENSSDHEDTENHKAEWIQLQDCFESKEEAKYENPSIEAYIIRTNTEWIADDIFYTDGGWG